MGGHGLLKARCPALPLAQDRKGGAEVVLRLGPGEGLPRAGALLERLDVGGHGLLKARCPALPLAQDHKDDAETVLRLGPGEGLPRAGALVERFGEGSQGLLKARCLALPLAQGRKGDAKRHMQGRAALRFDRTAFEQGGDSLGDALQALLQHPAAYFPFPRVAPQLSAPRRSAARGGGRGNPLEASR